MDFHKKEWEEKPVVLDKPRRGREMVTTDVPTVTSKTMAAAQQQEGDVEMYHEGWVDGKKYLVPDSNLEIMKDLVNLKIRRKGDSVFVKDKEYEASRFATERKFQRRLRAMSEKINKLESANVLKKKSMYKGNEAARPTYMSTGSSLQRRKPFRVVPISDESTTFLISGHIRQNSSPLFIIQKYKGKSPFGRKRSDFSQVQSARNVDILISGNFFRQSVLEEGLDSIQGIRLKWNLLVPVDERSKLYETRFSQHFDVKGIDILFEGDFIKQKGLLNYTPILTFLVPQPSSPTGRWKNKKRNIFKPISSMFGHKNVTTYNVQLESKASMKSTTDASTSSMQSSSEEQDGDWSSTEGLDEESRPTDGQVENDNGVCQIRLVMVSSRNGMRSVAGGSSSVKLTDVVQEWSKDEEETVVVYAAKGVEPHLRSYSSHSTCEGGSQETSDHGDAAHVKPHLSSHSSHSTSEGGSQETSDHVDEDESQEDPRKNKTTTTLHAVAGLRPTDLHPSQEKLVQRTLRKDELLTKRDTLTLTRSEIPEYKCQVRPSKRGSQRNCLIRNISKLFSKRVEQKPTQR